MIEIRSLKSLNLTDLERVAHGYSSDSKYVVLYTDEEGSVSFDLQLVTLENPYVKKFDHDDDIVQRYERVLKDGYSFGAYDGNLLAGLLVGEPHEWNRSVWVWEFHVAEAYRKLGIGKQLMEYVADKATHEGFRTIVCETQITNVTAIEIYRKLGFRAEICVCEIFGSQVAGGISTVGYGIHPFHDPGIKDEFYHDMIDINAANYHIYAMEWRPTQVSFFIDNVSVRTVLQSPHYPMQLMLGIYEIPDQLDDQSAGEPWPKAMEVDYVRAYRPLGGYEREQGTDR